MYLSLREKEAQLFKYSLWQEFQALEMCICCYINDVILFRIFE